jgi:hypothetical protein
MFYLKKKLKIKKKILPLKVLFLLVLPPQFIFFQFCPQNPKLALPLNAPLDQRSNGSPHFTDRLPNAKCSKEELRA